MGGCVFVSVAQSVFSNVLLKSLILDAPMLDPMAIVQAGATGLKDSLNETMYAAVASAYVEALQAVFALTIALTALALGLTSVVPWMTLLVERPVVA